MQKSLSIFISYSHKDRALREELEAHLSNLKRQNLISSWYDGDIVPGTEWEVQILEHLKTAQIILLLLSANFMASDFCYSIEMKEAIARHEAGETCVIPIVLRPTDWKGAPFAKLKILPTDAKAVTRWPTHDDAFENILLGIRKVLDHLAEENAPKPLVSSPNQSDGEVASVPFFTNPSLQPLASTQLANLPAFPASTKPITEVSSGSKRSISDSDPVRSSAQPQPGRFGKPFPEVWNVFRRHTPFFTGRGHVLQQIANGFQLESGVEIVLPQALTGLGGMGKTQTAAEYAYHFRGDYEAVLWVHAETQENLFADLKTIASLLKLPQERVQDSTSLIQTMQEWFRNHTGWLLIFDNADDLALVDPFLPRSGRGHILLTTRAGATIEQAQPLILEPLQPEDGALCILRRAGILKWHEPLHATSRANVDVAQELSQQMGGLPLALEQAGAYINDTACGIRRYLNLYDHHRSILRQMHSGTVPDYPTSVAFAWGISRTMVEQNNPASIELLQLCAHLSPEGIPDELLTQGAAALGPVLGPIAANPVALDQTIRLLRTYTLLNREADRDTDLTRLSIHRIMQEILLDEMDEPTRQLWAERAVCAVALALSTMEWNILQTHAQNCLQFIERWHMSFPEAELIRQRIAET